VITQFANGADHHPAAAATVAAALQRFPGEVSLLGLAVDLAFERTDTRAATIYLSQLPARLTALIQWQFRAVLLVCLEGPVERAGLAFTKLLTDAQGNTGRHSGTWNGSGEILAGLAERPVPEHCRATVRDLLSVLQP